MTTRDVSSKHESNVARALSGHRTTNSGATTFSKGDVLLRDAIIECKTKMSDCQSFAIQLDWLRKLERERIEMGKGAAALAISFDVGAHSYYVIDERTMQRFLEFIAEETTEP